LVHLIAADNALKKIKGLDAEASSPQELVR
jgi:hypothetical protein